MLNAKMCAITRVICTILEIHQTEIGVKYVLEKYRTEISFVKSTPIKVETRLEKVKQQKDGHAAKNEE